MSAVSITQRAMAASLAFILVSCGVTRYSAAGPTVPEDLARYAIIFESQPDGQVTHTWKPVADIDLTQYLHQLALGRVHGRMERMSTIPMTDDQIREACYEVYNNCFDRCLKSPLPSWASSYRSRYPNTTGGRKAAKEAFCGEECAKERDACFHRLKQRAQEAVKFSYADDAIDWVKRHKEEIAIGTVIVIAAVVFVAVACGSGGCLILIPIVLVASPGVPAEPYLAEVCQ